MEPFEFALMLVIQEKVLETVNVVSHVGLLQKKLKDVDLLQAAMLLENTCNTSSSTLKAPHKDLLHPGASAVTQSQWRQDPSAALLTQNAS